VKKDYRILIIIGMNIPETTETNLISHLAQHLFLHYLGKIEQTKYHFFIECDMIA